MRLRSCDSLALIAWLGLAGCSEQPEPDIVFPLPPLDGAGTAGVAGGADGPVSGQGGPADGPISGQGGDLGAAGEAAEPTGGTAAPGAGPTTGGAAPGTCDDAPAVTFADDVAPILSRCTDCHDDGGPASLDLRSYEAVWRGGQSGPVVVSGDCASSLLWLKTGETPPFGSRMPADGPPWLSDADRQTLCAWIDGGAPRDAMACPGPADAGAGDATDPPADSQPPSFDGVDGVEEIDGGCLLDWEAATDDVSHPSAIVYQVFVAVDGEAFDESAPATTTGPGQTSVVVELPAGMDYAVKVVAVDEAGNRDTNDRVRECSLR